MKTLALILMAVALAGCASKPVPLSGKADATGPYAAATLASVGTCEMDVAADYTALAMARTRTARNLGKGRITVDQARQVQAMADSARADLEAACPNKAARLNVARRDAARATLKTILETNP